VDSDHPSNPEDLVLVQHLHSQELVSRCHSRSDADVR
jgi:hypothetical protein